MLARRDGARACGRGAAAKAGSEPGRRLLFAADDDGGSIQPRLPVGGALRGERDDGFFDLGARALIRLRHAGHDRGSDLVHEREVLFRTVELDRHSDFLFGHVLETGLAEELNHRKTFGLAEPLDVIYFSYSISMIPTWRESILQAVANLKPQGKMYIVDFYDQRDLPQWFRTILKTWLRQFNVQFWNDLIPFLYDLEKAGTGRLRLESIAHRYAFIADFQTGSCS